MLDFATTLHLEEREKVVQQRIGRYFEEQGYRAKQHRDKELFYYERGSAWGNYTAMNPGHWHVFASVKLHTTDEQGLSVDVRLDVDTQGQIVLARERQYWETEFDVLTAYLETGKTKNQDILGELGMRNEMQNHILTGVITVVSIIGIFFLIAVVLAP